MSFLNSELSSAVARLRSSAGIGGRGSCDLDSGILGFAGAQDVGLLNLGDGVTGGSAVMEL